MRQFADMEQEADIVTMFPYQGGRKFIVASHQGRGFVVAEDECLGTTRKGKTVLTVKAPDEARLPGLQPEGYADAGLPVVVLKRSVGQPLIARLARMVRDVGLAEDLATIDTLPAVLRAGATEQIVLQPLQIQETQEIFEGAARAKSLAQPYAACFSSA